MQNGTLFKVLVAEIKYATCSYSPTLLPPPLPLQPEPTQVPLPIPAETRAALRRAAGLPPELEKESSLVSVLPQRSSNPRSMRRPLPQVSSCSSSRVPVPVLPLRKSQPLSPSCREYSLPPLPPPHWNPWHTTSGPSPAVLTSQSEKSDTLLSLASSAMPATPSSLPHAAPATLSPMPSTAPATTSSVSQGSPSRWAKTSGPAVSLNSTTPESAQSVLEAHWPSYVILPSNESSPSMSIWTPDNPLSALESWPTLEELKIPPLPRKVASTSSMPSPWTTSLARCSTGPASPFRPWGRPSYHLQAAWPSYMILPSDESTPSMSIWTPENPLSALESWPTLEELNIPPLPREVASTSSASPST
ncbi:hypothetical protein BGZ81_004253, partial [Podila clonocystis]